MPTEDFRHGFDNVADLLPMSPALMEQYLRAASGFRPVRGRAVTPMKHRLGFDLGFHNSKKKPPTDASR